MGEVDKKSVSLPPAFPREGPQTLFKKKKKSNCLETGKHILAKSWEIGTARVSHNQQMRHLEVPMFQKTLISNK